MNSALLSVRLLGATLLATGLLAAAPALAQGRPNDVKAGVDAWSRGDYAGAIRIWQPFADKGDADAQFNLGQAYRQGVGVPQDLQRAEVYYAKAAAQGHLRASDNYGLLLFQRGQHVAALPYIRDAADRGDPRAQYLMGLSFFNAEGVGKDWIRAYALESLAAQPMSGGPGLPQARQALAQMDKYIELQDRQKAISLATEMAAQIEANRNRQMAAVDLGTQTRTPLPSGPLPSGPLPSGMAGGSSTPPPPQVAIREPAPPTQTRPAPAPSGAPLRRPQGAMQPALPPVINAAPSVLPPPRPTATPRPAPVQQLASGSWKLQLGAFGVASNADTQWAKVKALPEIAGHGRHDAPSGKVTRLLATGYSEEAAKTACRRLAAAGVSCLPVKD